MAIKKSIGMSMESDKIMARLHRIGERVQKHSLDVMRRYAARVEKLAKLNVPVEDFHVEDAIVSQEKRTGQNRRVEITVGVDPDLLRQFSGQDYDYSIWLHESQYNLGELSAYKATLVASEDPRASVGNKFVERALYAVEDEAIRETKKAVKKAIKG
ncbi:hypothetical protein VCR15J2_390008 [Vibrio coralliirubri]|uniref:HK97 gp10 family phage protein n=1 Tax=Vibrio coralliirubri TaxID=1516159 RepID=UPI0006303568|nr:HK97 gp10 family phage protein [Vibrio coralliirubri]CDT52577.1 hypothetical protein VCR15J2_390008 [Vibrio coralliirubri]